MPIVFAGIVLAALLFLLIFNLSVSRKSRSRGSRPMPAAADEAPALLEKAAEPAPIRAGKEMKKDDQSYRQALRNFAGEERGKAPVVEGKPATRDHEYRKALRSLDRYDE